MDESTDGGAHHRGDAAAAHGPAAVRPVAFRPAALRSQLYCQVRGHAPFDEGLGNSQASASWAAVPGSTGRAEHHSARDLPKTEASLPEECVRAWIDYVTTYLNLCDIELCAPSDKEGRCPPLGQALEPMNSRRPAIEWCLLITSAAGRWGLPPTPAGRRAGRPMSEALYTPVVPSRSSRVASA